jgi:hypothetical protein
MSISSQGMLMWGLGGVALLCHMTLYHHCQLWSFKCDKVIGECGPEF